MLTATRWAAAASLAPMGLALLGVLACGPSAPSTSRASAAWSVAHRIEATPICRWRVGRMPHGRDALAPRRGGRPPSRRSGAAAVSISGPSRPRGRVLRISRSSRDDPSGGRRGRCVLEQSNASDGDRSHSLSGAASLEQLYRDWHVASWCGGRGALLNLTWLRRRGATSLGGTDCDGFESPALLFL